jgi:hypothetical protein
MATTLHQVLTFTAVPPGGIATLPHSLNVNQLPVPPDILFRDNGNFTIIAASDVSVTVQNTAAGVETLNAWLFVLHTMEREFGSNLITSLSPQPFIPAASGGGGGGGSTVISFRYVAVGGESDFTVSLPFAWSSANYNILCSCQGVATIPGIDLPDGLGDRTNTQFRVVLSFPLTAGDTLAFSISDYI